MNNFERARKLRRKIDISIMAAQELIKIDELTAEELKRIIGLYEKWETYIGKEVAKGMRIRYGECVYSVIKTHIVEEHLRPTDTYDLYLKIAPQIN